MTFGCASPRQGTETRTVYVDVERLVPVDARLTAPIPPPDFEPVTWLDGIVLGIHYRHKYEAYHERMAEIRKLGQD